MKVHRVFVTADIGREAIARLFDSGFGVDVHPRIEAPSYEMLTAQAASGVEALLTTIRDRIDDPLLFLGAASGLKIVARAAVGDDNIDVPAANRHGISIANTPDVPVRHRSLAGRRSPADAVGREPIVGIHHG